MSAAIAGKNIALAGTFTKLKRAEVEARLEALGATIDGSLSRETDLLIYGDEASGELAMARSYGVQAQDEAWLIDVLAGGQGAALSGPLSDYIARLDAYAAQLRAIPGLKVGYTRAPGASPEHLDALAQAWGVPAFSPALRNLYQQADGFGLFWVDTNHPEYSWGPSFKGLERLASSAAPVIERGSPPSELELFPWEAGGLIWVLPAADALNREEGYYDYIDDMDEEDGEGEERRVYGRVWRGEQIERAVRVFDVGLNYYPVGLLMEQSQAAPPVILGDDYGATWRDSRHATFEDYLEGMLNKNFQLAGRRELLSPTGRGPLSLYERPQPEPITALLHAPAR
jgi:hypothetical protein